MSKNQTIKQAFFPRWIPQRILIPKKLDLIIVSYGGVGTSFLLDFFSKYKQTNHKFDLDGFKHSSLPPISFNLDVKFIYVYGNPQMAAASLFRREFHRAQSAKLQKWKYPIRLIPKGMTLHEYALLGRDKFYFEDHFFNWYERHLTAIPTLFVRYETIFDNVHSLLEFANIPDSAVHDFPKKKKRESRRETISTETMKLLDKMYGSFASKLEKIDDIEVRCKGNRRLFVIHYLSKEYCRALSKQAIYEVELLPEESQIYAFKNIILLIFKKLLNFLNRCL